MIFSLRRCIIALLNQIWSSRMPIKNFIVEWSKSYKTRKRSPGPPFGQQDLEGFKQKLQTDIFNDAGQEINEKQPLGIGENNFKDYFNNTTYSGALTMLQKIQNDALYAENQILRYFDVLTTAVNNAYFRYGELISQNSSYLKAGQMLEITDGVGSFSEAVKPKIIIQGKEIPINSDAKAVYKIKVDSRPGNYTIPVKIEFTEPGGFKRTSITGIKYIVQQ